MMLETLLPARPDLGVVNRFGGVSVIPAAERGHVEYVRRVVTTGIDVDHVNRLGWTALLEAVVLGDGGGRHQEVVRILLDAGADPSIADRDGCDGARACGGVGVHRDGVDPQGARLRRMPVRLSAAVARVVGPQERRCIGPGEGHGRLLSRRGSRDTGRGGGRGTRCGGTGGPTSPGEVGLGHDPERLGRDGERRVHRGGR